MAEQKDKETKSSNEKTYLVRYRLKGEKGRNPRKITVQALNQADAKKTAIATIPGAEIVGGAKELSEGVLDFAGRLAKFASRCVGRACMAYAKSPIRDKGTISTTRKIMTREIAHGIGSGLVKAGGGEPTRPPKMKISGAKRSRTSKKTRRKKR
jgi:hypothetical protein